MYKDCNNCKFQNVSCNDAPCVTCIECNDHDYWQPMENDVVTQEKQSSDGSTASYYELPEGATELQDLIGHRNMNAQIGEIFRACYRYGIVEHSPKLRDIKKIIFYANAELERLEKYGE